MFDYVLVEMGTYWFHVMWSYSKKGYKGVCVFLCEVSVCLVIGSLLEYSTEAQAVLLACSGPTPLATLAGVLLSSPISGLVAPLFSLGNIAQEPKEAWCSFGPFLFLTPSVVHFWLFQSFRLVAGHKPLLMMASFSIFLKPLHFWSFGSGRRF